MVIVVLGMMLGATIGMTCVFAKTRWDSVDASDPRKAFAMEVYTTMRGKVPRFPRNGSNGNGSNGHHLGNRTGTFPERSKELEGVKQDLA
jgi:hypothetical protein